MSRWRGFYSTTAKNSQRRVLSNPSKICGAAWRVKCLYPPTCAFQASRRYVDFVLDSSFVFIQALGGRKVSPGHAFALVRRIRGYAYCGSCPRNFDEYRLETKACCTQRVLHSSRDDETRSFVCLRRLVICGAYSGHFVSSPFQAGWCVAKFAGGRRQYPVHGHDVKAKI